MKKYLLALLLMCLPFSSLFAQLELPRVSQKASVMQRIGLLDVTVTYSRPNVKGRVIWGELVPYNEVWRTGADEATTISFSEDVVLNGNKVPAGKYSLFTIPGKDEWTIIINKTAKQWGAFNYDKSKDLLRFQVKPEKTEFIESLAYYFSDVSVSDAILNIGWEKLKVSFKISFDLDTKAYSNIKKAIAAAGKDDWVTYAAAAGYAADNNVHITEALDWVEKSIAIEGTYFNYFVKAKLLAKLNRTKEALKAIELSRKAGQNDPDYKTNAPQIDKLYNDLKGKK